MARKGDTARAGESVQPRGRTHGDGIDRVSRRYNRKGRRSVGALVRPWGRPGAVAGTVCCVASARRGDTVAAHKLVQPPGEPRGGNAAARMGDAAADCCAIGAGALGTRRLSLEVLRRRAPSDYLGRSRVTVGVELCSGDQSDRSRGWGRRCGMRWPSQRGHARATDLCTRPTPDRAGGQMQPSRAEV